MRAKRNIIVDFNL